MASPIIQDTPQYQTLVLNRDDRLYGLDSKKYRVYAASSAANPLIQVQPTWNFQTFTSFPEKSALIENLIIDGQGQNITGIELDDVIKCEIRNVTIKNCNIGIRFHNYYGCWTECNLLKHIRMENVNTGILFDTDGPYTDGYPGDSAGHTIIDDVGISLADNSSAVGIQIGKGDYLIKPYSSILRANISLGSSNGTGLLVKNPGELKYGLVSLNVTGNGTGKGVDLQYAGSNEINDNQTFTYNTTKSFLL